MIPSSVSKCVNPIAPAVTYPTRGGYLATGPTAGNPPDSVALREIPGAYASHADFRSGVAFALIASGILWVAIGLAVWAVTS
jgi:hypothetical protein